MFFDPYQRNVIRSVRFEFKIFTDVSMTGGAVCTGMHAAFGPHKINNFTLTRALAIFYGKLLRHSIFENVIFS